MRLKEFEIFEAATPRATSSGNIATVANPHVAHNNKKPTKKWKPTDNALDMKGKEGMLLAGKDPATIRRQIQEGSLYEGWPLVAGLAALARVDAAGAARSLAALAGAGYAGYKKLTGKDDEETPLAAKKKNIFQKLKDRPKDIDDAVEKAVSG